MAATERNRCVAGHTRSPVPSIARGGPDWSTILPISGPGWRKENAGSRQRRRIRT